MFLPPIFVIKVNNATISTNAIIAKVPCPNTEGFIVPNIFTAIDIISNANDNFRIMLVKDFIVFANASIFLGPKPFGIFSNIATSPIRPPIIVINASVALPKPSGSAFESTFSAIATIAIDPDIENIAEDKALNCLTFFGPKLPATAAKAATIPTIAAITPNAGKNLLLSSNVNTAKEPTNIAIAMASSLIAFILIENDTALPKRCKVPEKVSITSAALFKRLPRPSKGADKTSNASSIDLKDLYKPTVIPVPIATVNIAPKSRPFTKSIIFVNIDFTISNNLPAPSLSALKKPAIKFFPISYVSLEGE